MEIMFTGHKKVLPGWHSLPSLAKLLTYRLLMNPCDTVILLSFRFMYFVYDSLYVIYSTIPVVALS